jgi:tetratricopeptide (TPR) repeat protein
MARTITQYRIFIGSPGGLDAERKLFRDTVAKFNTNHARQHLIEFEAVGWEDTLPGVGRPQKKINEDLEQCDYAIFAFHDWWGSPTGNGTLVGTEEEWQIAQRLYAEYKLRQMALFFKAVPPAQEKDPGDELKKVLAFKQQIFGSKKHLCGSFKRPRDFADQIEKHLAEWLAQHLKSPDEQGLLPSQSSVSIATAPSFAYWHDEAWTVMKVPTNDYAAGLIFANRAVEAATNADGRSKALHVRAYAHYYRDEFAESLISAQEVIDLLADIPTADGDVRMGRTLIIKGLTLRKLDRNEDAIAAYDDLIARYGDSNVEALREQVAIALINKGVILNNLQRRDEAIAVNDDVIARYGDSNVEKLRIQVARALFSKALKFDGFEAIAIYDDLIKRYCLSDAELLREKVADALFWKSCELARLKMLKPCIAALEAWDEKRGGFDCDAIADNAVFFRQIQDDPEFAAYLASKGCGAG